MPKNHYGKTKEQVKSNYQNCLFVAFMPIAFSALNIITGGKNNKPRTVPLAASRTLGVISLLVTIPLTCITLPAALIGAVANSGYAAIALPIAAHADSKNNEKTTEITTLNEQNSPSSTQKMVIAMPQQTRQDTIDQIPTHPHAPIMPMMDNSSQRRNDVDDSTVQHLRVVRVD